MIITSDLAAYIGLAVRAAADPDAEIQWTEVCPECELVPDDIHGMDHLLVDVVEAIDLGDGIGHPAMRAVIVACEGYLTINPAIFGLGAAHPDWQDWREPPADWADPQD